MTDAPAIGTSQSVRSANGAQFYRVLRDYAVVVTLLILVGVVAAGNPSFLSTTNLINMLSQWAPAGIIAAGMTFIALTGGFDLSVASAFSLCAVVAAIIGQRADPAFAFLAAIAAGALVGLINGFLIARIRINPYITTVGTSFILNGVALLCTGNAAYIVSNPHFSDLGAGQLFGVGYSGIILVATFVSLQLVLSRTVYGQLVYSVGGNYEASWLSGIRVQLIVASTYVLLGVCAGVSGSITASQLSSAQANMDPSLIFDVLTIVVVGGTSLAGGSGAVWRTAVGLAIIATISNGFVLVGISPYYQDVIKGAIIVGALSLDALLMKLTRNPQNDAVSRFVDSFVWRIRELFGRDRGRQLVAEARRLGGDADIIGDVINRHFADWRADARKVLARAAVEQPSVLEDSHFRRLAFEVAFAEYAISLASEMTESRNGGGNLDPTTKIRATIHQLAAIALPDETGRAVSRASAVLANDPSVTRDAELTESEPLVSESGTKPQPLGRTASPARSETRFILDEIISQCENDPARYAIQDPKAAITYGELLDWSGRIAASLRAEGIRPGDIVGVAANPSAMAIVGLVGIWRAGAAFAAIDPNAPGYWTDDALTRIGAEVVIAGSAQPQSRRLTIQELLARGTSSAGTVPQRFANSENLAYISFTSGSTGSPKAVAIEHRHLSAYVKALNEKLKWDTQGRFAFLSPLHLDFGYTSLFPALAGGGTVLVSPPETRTDVLKLSRFLSDPYDHLKITPSHLSVLLDHPNGARCLPSSVLICGGELLSWELVDRVRAQKPELEIFNHYGQTETTIGTTAFRVPRDQNARISPSVPIGTPLRGVSIELRKRGEFGGNAGEIVTTGPTIGRGYLADKARLTPFEGSNADTSATYATGDIASQLPDGSFVFSGRVEEQVKMRGFRVDLQTVRAAIQSLPGVKSAKVYFDREQQIISATVISSDAVNPVTEHQVRSSLQRRLPEVWIPAKLVVTSSMRFGGNGKADAAIGDTETASWLE